MCNVYRSTIYFMILYGLSFGITVTNILPLHHRQGNNYKIQTMFKTKETEHSLKTK